ncbi:hypothetical protein BC830DRAFT_586372 [Chytriomyces sp. MP71]|nr:hypothetical protein BC830DRAFT_586372 [Chytriomyces sp. MP71]
MRQNSLCIVGTSFRASMAWVGILVADSKSVSMQDYVWTTWRWQLSDANPKTDATNGSKERAAEPQADRAAIPSDAKDSYLLKPERTATGTRASNALDYTQAVTKDEAKVRVAGEKELASESSAAAVPEKPVVETPLTKAIKLYNEASVCEREGRLGDALLKYRLATKLEPNIDRIHRSTQSQTIAPPAVSKKSSEQNVFDDLGLQTYYSLDGNMDPLLPAAQESHLPYADVRFIPKDANRPVAIAILPSELVTQIVKWALRLDFAVLPAISSTCRFFNRTTLSASLWRFLCEKHHGNQPGSYSIHPLRLSEQLATKYRDCWRAMYCEKPRINLAGVYISRVNYIRQGLGESFTNPFLIVTYFRYLRLFQDGSMFIWTSSVEPAQALKDISAIMEDPANTYSLRKALGESSTSSKRHHREKASAIASLKGLLFGTWRLENDVLIMDTSENVNAFHYELSFSSTRRAAHNKLTWVDFYHWKMGGGKEMEEASRSEIKTHRKPFVFSGVRSWKKTHY